MSTFELRDHAYFKTGQIELKLESQNLGVQCSLEKVKKSLE